MACDAWQYNAAAPIARIFHIRARLMRLVPMVARDTFVREHERMLVRVLDLGTVADGCGDEFDLGEPSGVHRRSRRPETRDRARPGDRCHPGERCNHPIRASNERERAERVDCLGPMDSDRVGMSQQCHALECASGLHTRGSSR